MTDLRGLSSMIPIIPVIPVGLCPFTGVSSTTLPCVTGMLRNSSGDSPPLSLLPSSASCSACIDASVAWDAFLLLRRLVCWLVWWPVWLLVWLLDERLFPDDSRRERLPRPC